MKKVSPMKKFEEGEQRKINLALTLDEYDELSAAIGLEHQSVLWMLPLLQKRSK